MFEFNDLYMDLILLGKTKPYDQRSLNFDFVRPSKTKPNGCCLFPEITNLPLSYTKYPLNSLIMYGTRILPKTKVS